MIAEIELGAELTDASDIRLLRTLCETWLSDDLFSTSFAFTSSITVPRLTSFNEYIDYFNTLPDCESPETFGLTPGADKT